MKPQFITNDKGKKIAVVIPLADYNQMLEDIEELQDIKAYDKAKMVNEPSVPFGLAIRELEQKRKKRK